jgi:hypothetical protein
MYTDYTVIVLVKICLLSKEKRESTRYCTRLTLLQDDDSLTPPFGISHDFWSSHGVYVANVL